VRSVVAAVAALAVLTPGGVADTGGGAVSHAAEGKHKRTCKLNGATVFRNSEMRIVTRGTSARALFGCVKTVGVTRRLGGGSSYRATADATLLAAAGHIVAVSVRSYAVGSVDRVHTSVRTVHTGRQLYELSSYLFDTPSVERVAAVRVTGGGRAATAMATGSVDNLGRFADSGIAVIAFSARGKRRVLDSGPPESIPPSSLTLRRGRVGWTKNGTRFSARL
jgi:hypothetical protein